MIRGQHLLGLYYEFKLKMITTEVSVEWNESLMSKLSFRKLKAIMFLDTWVWVTSKWHFLLFID